MSLIVGTAESIDSKEKSINSAFTKDEIRDTQQDCPQENASHTFQYCLLGRKKPSYSPKTRYLFQNRLFLQGSKLILSQGLHLCFPGFHT